MYFTIYLSWKTTCTETSRRSREDDSVYDLPVDVTTRTTSTYRVRH